MLEIGISLTSVCTVNGDALRPAPSDPLGDALAAAGMVALVPALGKVFKERTTPVTASLTTDVVGHVNEYSGTAAADANAPADAARPTLLVASGLRSLQFDGVNDALVSAPGVSLTGDFTVAAAFKTTRAAYQFLYYFWDVDLAKGINLALDPSGTPYLEVSGAGYTALNGVTAIKDGTPHVLVATRVGTTATLYIDGVPDATGTVDGGNATVTTPAYNGTRHNGVFPLLGSGYFFGLAAGVPDDLAGLTASIGELAGLSL